MKIYFLLPIILLVTFSCSKPEEEIQTGPIKQYLTVENEEFFDFHSFSDVLNKVVLHDPEENLIYFFHRSNYDKTDVYIFNYEEKYYYKNAIETDWILYGTHSLNYHLKELYVSYNGTLRVYDSITLELKEIYLVSGNSSKVSGYGFENIIFIGVNNILYVYRRSDKTLMDQVSGGNSLVQCFEENDTIYTFTGNIGSTPYLRMFGKSGQVYGGYSFPKNSSIQRNIFSNNRANFLIGNDIVFNKWDLSPIDTLKTPSINYAAISEDGNLIYTVSEFRTLFTYDANSFDEINSTGLPSVPRYVFSDDDKIIIIYQEGNYGNRVKVSIY